MNSSPRKHAFTLLELLAVIAIISVLGALLFPVIRGVSRSMDSAACVSNLRQIGNAIQLYANEHNHRFPGVGLTSNGTRRWNLLLNDYFFEGRGTVAQSKFDKSTLFCPSVGKMSEDFLTDSPYARTYAINIMTFIGWTDQIVADYGYPDAPPPAGYNRLILGESLARFEKKASTILVGEVEFPTEVMQAHENINPIPKEALTKGYLYKGGRQAYRHDQQMNVLFMDGHVAARGLDGGMDLRSTFAADVIRPGQ